MIVENNKVKLVTQELIAQPKDNTFAEKIHRVLATELLDSEEIYDGGQIKVSPDNDQPRLVAARQNKEEVELETRVVLVSDHNRMETQKKQCNKKIEEENIDDRLTLEDKKRSSYNVSSMSESKMEAETSMMMMKMAITKSLIQQAGGVKRSIVVICSSRINVVNTTTTLFGASTIHDFQDSIKVDDRNGGESELRDVVVVMDLAGHQLQPNPTLQTVSPSSMPISHTARGLLEYLADEEVKQVLKMVNMIEDNNIDGKSDNSCGFCCDSDSAVSVTSCELKITTTTTADNNTVVEVEHQNTGKSVECWKSNARSRDSCSAGGGGRRGGGGGKGAKYLPLPMMQRIPLLLLQNYALSTFAGLFNYCLAANHRAEDVVVVAEEEEEDYEMDEEEEGDASAPHSSTINEEESFKNLSESPIQQLQRILDNRYEVGD